MATSPMAAGTSLNLSPLRINTLVARYLFFRPGKYVDYIAGARITYQFPSYMHRNSFVPRIRPLLIPLRFGESFSFSLPFSSNEGKLSLIHGSISVSFNVTRSYAHASDTEN